MKATYKPGSDSSSPSIESAGALILGTQTPERETECLLFTSHLLYAVLSEQPKGPRQLTGSLQDGTNSLQFLMDY